MKPKYNIGDEVIEITNYSIYSLLNPTFYKITEIETKELKNGEKRYSYKVGSITKKEKVLTSKQEHIAYLKEKASELITLANNLEKNAN